MSICLIVVVESDLWNVAQQRYDTLQYTRAEIPNYNGVIPMVDDRFSVGDEVEYRCIDRSISIKENQTVTLYCRK